VLARSTLLFAQRLKRSRAHQVNEDICRCCFATLVGSIGIATRLDPEQWRETVAGYHRAAADAITRFDGYVAKYLGDGVLNFRRNSFFCRKIMKRCGVRPSHF
jgi:class 3 adenylate cyclase